MVLKIKYCIYCCLLFCSANAQNSNRISGQLIVQLFKGDDIRAVVHEIQNKNNILISDIKNVSERLNIFTIHFDPIKQKEEIILESFLKHPKVANVQFNHTIQERILPNDTFFSEQWSMYNDGTTGGLLDADIDADLAWDITTGGLTVNGDTIVVAIIGEGAYFPHEDLHYWKNLNEIPLNLIDDDGNGYIDDYDGWNSTDLNGIIPERNHGTHVAGIIGAIGNNNLGVSGVNWNVRVLPVYNLSNEAEAVGSYAYAFSMRELYDQTNGEKGAFIVATNSSFGINFGNPNDFPIWCAMYDSLGTLGILSIGSTANFSANIDVVLDMPTSCPSDHLITVTSTDKADNLAVAAYGPLSIDLGAPGSFIYSTITFNAYGILSGTSMSAPHVAGSVALMFSAACEKFMEDYNYDPESMALLLKEYILNGVDFTEDLNGITVSSGRLNVYKALNNLLETGYCSVSIDEQNVLLSQLNVFPNPTSDFLYIAPVNNFSGAVEVLIYNQTGQLVKTQQFSYFSTISEGVSVQDLPAGMYFIKINQYEIGIQSTANFIIQY